MASLSKRTLPVARDAPRRPLALGKNRQVEETTRIDRTRHDFRIEGVVVHMFMGLDISQYDFLEDPPPK